MAAHYLLSKQWVNFGVLAKEKLANKQNSFDFQVSENVIKEGWSLIWVVFVSAFTVPELTVLLQYWN